MVPNLQQSTMGKGFTPIATQKNGVFTEQGALVSGSFERKKKNRGKACPAPPQKPEIAQKGPIERRGGDNPAVRG